MRHLATLLLALAAGATRLEAQAAAAARPALSSAVFPGDSGRVRTTSTGARQRAIFDTVTALHPRLEMHETTLAPGQAPHAAHRHIHEEMFIVLRGTVTVQLGEAKRTAGPGSVIFCASNELHGISNASDAEASYLVLRLDTPAAVEMAKAAAAARGARP